MRNIGPVPVIVLSTVALVGLAVANPFGIAKTIQETKIGDTPSVGGHQSEVELGSPWSGDAVRGKTIFEKRCTGCHALEADREGPRLAGVYGRKAGSVPGFDYSTGLKTSGITWTDATLEKWLTDPEMMVPDANMDFRVPKAQERLDVIAYLKATSQALRGE